MIRRHEYWILIIWYTIEIKRWNKSPSSIKTYRVNNHARRQYRHNRWWQSAQNAVIFSANGPSEQLHCWVISVMVCFECAIFTRFYSRSTTQIPFLLEPSSIRKTDSLASDDRQSWGFRVYLLCNCCTVDGCSRNCPLTLYSRHSRTRYWVLISTLLKHNMQWTIDNVGDDRRIEQKDRLLHMSSRVQLCRRALVYTAQAVSTNQVWHGGSLFSSRWALDFDP